MTYIVTIELYNDMDIFCDLRCTESTQSDYLEFSNFMPVDTRFRRRCGYEKDPFMVVSEKKFFRITFMSNEQYDGSGFIGTYHFTDNLDMVYAAAAGIAPGGALTARKIKVISADNNPDDEVENQGESGGSSGGDRNSTNGYNWLFYHTGKYKH